MATFFQQKSKTLPHAWGWSETLRYWIVWTALVVVFGWTFHRYLEHRNHELDKRIEQLSPSPPTTL